MTFDNFKTQCLEYLPKQGCKNIKCDAILTLGGLTYKCTFEYKDKFHSLTCTHFGIWRLRCEDDIVAEIGHIYIENCCDKYFKEEL